MGHGIARSIPMSSETTLPLASSSNHSIRLRRMNQFDVKTEIDFDRRLSFHSRYFRFGSDDARLYEERLQQLCADDQCTCRCFIAEVEEQGTTSPVAFGRFEMDADKDCEMSIIVADEWQGKGLGRQITEALIAGAKACGMRRMYVDVLASNTAMLRLAHRCGFVESKESAPGLVKSLCLVLDDYPVGEDRFDTASTCPDSSPS